MKCIFPGCEREATARLVNHMGAALMLTDARNRPTLAYHCDVHQPVIEERIAMFGIGGGDGTHYERFVECPRSG